MRVSSEHNPQWSSGWRGSSYTSEEHQNSCTVGPPSILLHLLDSISGHLHLRSPSRSTLVIKYTWNKNIARKMYIYWRCSKTRGKERRGGYRLENVVAASHFGLALTVRSNWRCNPRTVQSNSYVFPICRSSCIQLVLLPCFGCGSILWEESSMLALELSLGNKIRFRTQDRDQDWPEYKANSIRIWLTRHMTRTHTPELVQLGLLD